MFKFWKKKPAPQPAAEPAPAPEAAPSAGPLPDLAAPLPVAPTTPLPPPLPPVASEPVSVPEPPPAAATEVPAVLPPPVMPVAEPAATEPAPLPPPIPEPAPLVESLPEPAAEPAAEPIAAEPVKRSWRERLSGSHFARSLGSLFHRNPKLDDDLLDELETTLLTADVGVEASTGMVENLRKRMHKREFADAPALLAALRQLMIEMLTPVAVPLDVSSRKPFVILTVGINGAGKTTTIGKLAHRFGQERRQVILAAGDTFRAAAVAQLQTWGDRNQITVMSQGQDADAASVIFDALQSARSRQTDVLIADTAGRLHTQGGLMDELGKIARVLKKQDPEAPHEVLMVIDGTTGQNAVNQVRQFRQVVGVTGLVVTKLDGTAKGGVIFALAREFGLPVRYVGIGESLGDLQVFDVEAYVDGLLPAHLGQG
ncbi:signal recognition particle-docking protein FtsY [Frateuria aurantia]|uniref:Signal recognition particle receptor FtsY n=1 Tax=Frateuria aurantia (strain ATCC 33424 / DSM 6220 / KCTC 2777 / LMG 1558 / NBRC 3245 / NCIMB 13370) TaxID=767434 RepID=H8L2C3_FRAAD|nr:signal recognition particle-docking protein FtsY [Frateuria aurantia]AFC84757.1 signal recognition particle-docking protein FtsY [Frateuria aurantia DSM 6220]